MEYKQISAVEDLFTLNELSTQLKVSASNIYNLVRARHQNGFPVILVGRQYRFVLTDVLKWFQERDQSKKK